MPQHHQLTITLGKHLSGQVDRALGLWEDSLANTDKLNKALDRVEGATAALHNAVEKNKPQG